MKKYVLLGLPAAGSVSACKKDSQPAAPKTKADLLVNKPWRASGATVSTTVNGKPQPQDVFAKLPACFKDHFSTYKADKSFVDDEGTTKCSTTDPQTTAGTWDFGSDQTKLYLTYPGQGTESVDVTQLTETTMVWSYVDTSLSPATTVVITYTAP